MKQVSEKLKIIVSILVLVLVIIMYATITNFNKLMAAGGIVTILIILVGEIIKLFVDPKEILRIIEGKKSRLTGSFKWQPNTPIKNDNASKAIDKFPITHKFSFETKDFEVRETNGKISFLVVEGVEAFKSKIIHLVNTPKNSYKVYEGADYGVEHSLFTCEDNIEFSRQANSLAYQIIKSSCGEWIEEIYSIQKKKEILIIELRGCGRSETLKFEIPNWHTE